MSAVEKVSKLTRKSYGAIFMIAGVVLGIFGLLFKYAFYNKAVYDLPWFLVMIGAAVLIYGISQFFNSAKAEQDVVFSSASAKTFFLKYALIFALFVLILVVIIIEPNFMKIDVLLDILSQSSIKMIIALGICMTLLIAGTDLSAGRMVGLAAVISTSMLQIPTYANRFYPGLPQVPVILPIIIAILVCGLFGVLNGFLVAKFNMHPFIATLATQVMIYGVASLYFDLPPNNSQPIGGVRGDFTVIAQYKFLGNISILIPIALVVTIVMWFILNKTVFGKNIYAIGGNMEAARVSGVNVFKTIMGIFIFAGLLYGFGGVLEAARTAGATNNYGNGYELDAIAACCVGGVSLAGGIGKVSGIVVGVLIFTVIQYGLQFIGVSPYWQQIIKGIIIAIAVAIDLSKYKKALWH
jgi:methyl-galactoside transport system permease protein